MAKFIKCSAIATNGEDVTEVLVNFDFIACASPVTRKLMDQGAPAKGRTALSDDTGAILYYILEDMIVIEQMLQFGKVVH